MVRSEIRRRLLLLVCALALSAASAQEARFSRLSRRDGLSSSAVSSIVQDSRGFLWLGTKNGLNRYDGYDFVVYSNDPFEPDSLSHNLVQTLFMDSDDVLWVGTYRGLNRFDTSTKRFVRFVHDPSDAGSLSSDIVTSIYRDSAKRLWVGTLDGLNAFDESRGKFIRYRDVEGGGRLPDDTVRAALETRDGVLWFATYGGLLRYDRSSDSFSVVEGLPSAIVMALAEDASGALWIGCWGGGLARLDADRKTLRSWKFPDNRIYALCAAYEGVVYAGTWGGGLVELDASTGAFALHRADPRAPYALANDVVYSLFKDDSGLLWVGTNGGGLHKLDRSRDRFDLFVHDPRAPGSISQGAVLSVLEDSRGRLWAGTYNGGLNRLDPGAGAFIHYRNDPRNPRSLSNDIVNGIMEDAEGAIWVATNEGLNRFDESGGFERFEGKDETFYSIAVDAEGRHWYGNYRKGAERWDPRTGERLRFFYDPRKPDSLSDNLVYFIKRDSRGDMWLGTNDGLNRWDPGSGAFVRYGHRTTDRTSLPSGTLRCMLEDSRGRLWFGTASGGLSLLDRESGTFEHFGKRDGFPDDSVLSLQEDGSGRLWVGTNYGLCVFDPRTRDVKALDERDGLQGPEFTAGSFKSVAGDLYFGGANGLNRIRDASLRRNPHEPPVRLTSFKVFDRELDLGDDIADIRELRLSHRENFVSIEFSALDFADPSLNRYSYMLEGFDKDWSRPGNRRYASYTNLPGGSYVFRVKASNNHGVWNEEGAGLRIVVTPGFWETPAAWVLYLAALVFVYVGVQVWSSRGQRLRVSVAELEERRRVGAELNAAKERAESADRAKSEFLANLSHEIRTPMNAVLGYASILSEKMADDPRRSLVDVIDRSGRSLLTLLNDALDLSRMDAGKSPPRAAPVRIRGLLSDLAEMFRLRAEEKGIALSAVVDPGVPPLVLGDETKLRQMLVNLIGNAIKFTDRGEVRVDAAAEGEPASLVLRVADTGMGLSAEDKERVFEPFFQQSESAERRGGTGLGLTIVKRLAEELGGTVAVESALGRGSVFTVVVPDLRAPADSMDALQDAAEVRRLDGIDILIVEDDSLNADILGRMLESRGASVRIALDGNEGLREVGRRRPDAVCADVRMPRMDGFAFLDSLRAGPSASDVPALIVTADLRAETLARLAAYRAVFVVPKPIDRKLLLDRLENALPGKVVRGPVSVEPTSARILDARALEAELGAEKAGLVVAALSGEALSARRAISAALIIDEWNAFLGAAEGVFFEFGSRELGLWVSRARAALSAFDAEALARLRAEFDALVRDAAG